MSRALRIALLLAAPLAVSIAIARADPLSPGWIDWNGTNFFGPCQGDCSVALYGGRQVTSAMEPIFYINYPALPPWKWHWGGSELIAGSFSRRLLTLGNALNIEPELGIGKRFGELTAGEFWGALVFRWTAFPWNDTIKTSIAVSEGLSITTQVDSQERALSDYEYTSTGWKKTGSIFLNYFSPEMTFALPQFPAYELLVRFHHRSGIFGLINDVHAGAQYETVGIRIHF
jgi:hypothetical protein